MNSQSLAEDVAMRGDIDGYLALIEHGSSWIGIPMHEQTASV
jgi:hypothetical protein